MMNQVAIKPQRTSLIERGEILSHSLKEDPEQRYFLYIPPDMDAQTPVLVAVHGISRNAREQAEQFSAYAERYNVIVLAPLFCKQRFQDYQRLGRIGRGLRSDLALNRMIAEVGYLTQTDTRKTYLFGYSGGGQFVHRYAMAHPHRVARITIGAAGWYSYPNPAHKFPYGISPIPALPSLTFCPELFLRIPASVLVGEWDTERDPGLNQSRRIDQQQGLNRLERGRRWIKAMQAAAAEYQLETDYSFTALPASGHSFVENMLHGHLAMRVFESLFGTFPDAAQV